MENQKEESIEDIEELYIKGKRIITQLPNVESVRVTTASIRSFLRELRVRVESLGYEIKINRYESLVGESDYKEVLGILYASKGGVKAKYNPLAYAGIILLILGILWMFFNPAGLILIFLGVLCFVLPIKLGIKLRIPEKPPERLIILYEGTESSGVRKRDIKLEGELKEVKGVELTYRVAELDFKVGGTVPRDVDNVVSFLEKYKALA